MLVNWQKRNAFESLPGFIGCRLVQVGVTKHAAVFQCPLIAPEVSESLLQNGVRLAENVQILDTAGGELAERRLRFAYELHDTIRRIDTIDALASARRAGALRLGDEREVLA